LKRKRLTITLDARLLERIDSIIDKNQIRNRSHAIEFLIKKSLPPGVTRAVILAGGPGVHFRPLTYEIPSALIPFKDKPLLSYTIDQLKKAGIEKIVLCIGHLGEKIIDQFGDGHQLGVEISYSRDGQKPLGTAGAIWQARHHLKGEPFLVISGDILSNIDLSDLINFHDRGKCAATLALTTIKNPAQHGVVKVKGNKIVSFNEKPDFLDSDSNLIHAGVYILENSVFEFFPKKRPLVIEKDVFPKIVKAKEMKAYLFEGQWFDISYPKVYEKALKKFKLKEA